MIERLIETFLNRNNKNQETEDLVILAVSMSLENIR